MSYIVLNGVKNTDVNGLMIQTLPPISKPLMRTKIEQIDGRDGDVVTPLGYAAYDKTVVVGLRGDYDVDAVIAYFASEGTVIFSTEPDKQYRYRILAQIDFEKLFRFRTAKVVFHVQPFKYPVFENLIVRSMEMPFNLPRINTRSSNINVSGEGKEIEFYGESSFPATFIFPIDPLTLPSGDYTFSASVSDGTVPIASYLRLLTTDDPRDVNSFAGGTIELKPDAVLSISDTVTAPVTYRYVWFTLQGGGLTNFKISMELIQNDGSVVIRNVGNTFAKPKITVYGTDTITLFLNDEYLTLSFGYDTVGHVTIDVDAMEAYRDDLDHLMNRYVTGNYENMRLAVGKNVLSWVGHLSKIEVSNYSRWI